MYPSESAVLQVGRTLAGYSNAADFGMITDLDL